MLTAIGVSSAYLVGTCFRYAHNVGTIKKGGEIYSLLFGTAKVKQQIVTRGGCMYELFEKYDDYTIIPVSTAMGVLAMTIYDGPEYSSVGKGWTFEIDNKHMNLMDTDMVSDGDYSEKYFENEEQMKELLKEYDIEKIEKQVSEGRLNVCDVKEGSQLWTLEADNYILALREGSKMNREQFENHVCWKYTLPLRKTNFFLLCVLVYIYLFCEDN